MKRLYLISILLLLLSSCSIISFNDEMTNDQEKYINDLIVCDCKSTDFTVTNQDELDDFFVSDKNEIVIKYDYRKRKGIDLKREIEIKKVIINDRAFYYAKFNKFTFPGSDCDDLKKEVRFFE